MKYQDVKPIRREEAEMIQPVSSFSGAVSSLPGFSVEEAGEAGSDWPWAGARAGRTMVGRARALARRALEIMPLKAAAVQYSSMTKT